MSAHDALGVQFDQYYRSDLGQHMVSAIHKGKSIGELAIDEDGTVANISVADSHQRQGIATGMWKYAQQRASAGRLPTPHHSSDRTVAGDAWAHKVGGHLPELG